jgi:uncharacterized protein (TIGR03086 family)
MPTNNCDTLDLNRRATLRCIDLVAIVRSEDLQRPTPCAEWRLADLLAHMTIQHLGFAAAASGDGELFDWTPRPLGPHYAQDYAAAAHEALSAFDAPGALDRHFVLTEIPEDPSFPGKQAIGFHFIDAVVHGWDVARSIGAAFDIPEDFAAPAVQIAQAVPGGPYREHPNAAFGPILASPEAPSPLDVVLTALGRSPSWPN